VSGEDRIARFESGEISPDMFHHADHVRLAFEYLRRYSAIEALDKFSDALQRFAASQGKADRYHETITWAYLFLIRERMARVTSTQTWEQFAEQNPDLLVWRPSLLDHYYRKQTLESGLARKTFIFPDRIASEPAN
jgi:hypothetical protein